MLGPLPFPHINFNPFQKTVHLGPLNRPLVRPLPLSSSPARPRPRVLPQLLPSAWRIWQAVAEQMLAGIIWKNHLPDQRSSPYTSGLPGLFLVVQFQRCFSGRK